ncbi:MAG TPA: class I SAM-dependent methyltransferase [Candidatus Lokiarchaeia archaeon]
MKEYWESRYISEGRIWGEIPSKTAEYALSLFQKFNIKKILVHGAGYGRNTKLFSRNGFDVVGIEISDTAINIAKVHDPLTKFYNASIFDMHLKEILFDAIYCYNTLHLFPKQERQKMLRICYDQLKENGFVFFVVMSESDFSYGKGKKTEKNTYESKTGRPIHYFLETDLIKHFKAFSTIEIGVFEEKESHGEQGPHIHNLRYIFAEKII